MQTIAEMQAESAWLAALQPGDKVIVRAGHYGAKDHTATVARVTKHQVVLRYQRGETRFWKKDGWELGSSATYSRADRLAQWTPERAAALDLDRLQEATRDACRAVLRQHTAKLTADQCRRVLAVLREVGLVAGEE